MAAQAGIGHSTLHHYFATKEALVAAVLEWVTRQFEGTFPAGNGPADQLRGHLAGLGRLIRARPDNGRGGADFSHGTGLIGLKDRAEALGGRLRLQSPPGAGTTLEITLPLSDPTHPEPPPGAAGLFDDASPPPASR